MKINLDHALALFRKKKWREALQAFLESDSDENSAQLIAYYLGLCYARLGDHEKAILYLEQVVSSDIDPIRSYQCRLALAYLYSVSQKPELADRELGKLLKNGFESVQIFGAKAYASYRMGNIERSIELYKKALSLDPENATILNSLGYILADSGRELTQALIYIKKAVEMDAKNPAYLDSLGWVYFKMKSAKEARTWLSRALTIATGNPEIRNHIETLNRGE